MQEITAEFEVQDIAPKAELTVRTAVTVGGKTDMGRVRENNEDKYEFYIPESDDELASRGMIFIVCDGMGGHEAGQHASELTVKTFIDVYRGHPSASAEDAATAAANAANRFVLDVSRAIPSRKGMGTTLTVLILLQGQAICVHAGDSRLYRLRGGELTQMTRDHTWVEDIVESGMLSREEAEVHQYRHVITKAVGTAEALEPNVFSEAAETGDVYMLCSDGITNHVGDEEISSEMANEGPSAASWNLVNRALTGGGSDNATVIVVRVDELQPIS
jgi:protein phosphatase